MANSFSTIGVGIALVVISVLVLDEIAASALAVYLTTYAAARIAASFAVSAVLYRLPAHQVWSIGCVITAGSYAMLLATSGDNALGLLMVCGFLGGVGASGASLAIRMLVDPWERTAEGAGLYSYTLASTQVFAVAAPLAAGISAFWFAPREALLFAAVMLLSSAAVVPKMDGANRTANRARSRTGGLSDLVAELKGKLWLRVSLVQHSVQLAAVYAPLEFMLKINAVERWGQQGLSVLLAVQAAGSVCAASTASRWRPINIAVFVGWCYASFSIVGIALAFQAPFIFLLAAIALGAYFSFLRMPLWYSAVTRSSSERARPHVHAAEMTLNGISDPVGIGWVMLLMPVLGLPLVAGISGGLCLLVGLCPSRIKGYRRWDNE